MIPLIDTHCHLHPALDDGPLDVDEAWEMCRIAWQDGVRAVAATAHQNPHWPAATPERIRSSTRELQTRLSEAQIPLAVYPCGEVMLGPELLDDWLGGRLVSVADTGRYLLIEMPHGVFLDIRELVQDLAAAGVRPILAHPERCPELWFRPAMMVELIARGCLMQVCASGVLSPHKQTQRHLRRWLDADWVHLVASDGHSVAARSPGLSAAFDRIAGWTDNARAECLCSANGLAVLEGRSLDVPQPQPHRPRRRWFFLRR